MIGFTNLGNTCYLASSLQALMGVPAFVAQVLALEEKLKTLRERLLVSHFVNLCQAVQNGNVVMANLRLGQIKDDMGTVDRRFLSNKNKMLKNS